MKNEMNISHVDNALSGLGFQPLGTELTSENGGRDERRRAFFRREPSPFEQLTLIRSPDGVLRWHEGIHRSAGFPVRSRASRAALSPGKIEQQYVYERLHDPSQVVRAISNLDDTLTNVNRRGLWKWTSGGWEDVAPGTADLAKRKVLLFIHGTFSHGDKIFEDLNGSAHGTALLKAALKEYDCVLAFNHPTLGVSPAVNAFTLASELRDPKGLPKAIDIVCHSRGGLVSRWFIEGFASPGPKYRCVFVGAPLGGTNLASPPRLRGAFNFITNVADALGTGAGMTGVPFLQFAGGMLKVIGSVTKLASHTPALDAAIAAVPGLAAQSRIGNNHEIAALRTAGAWQAQDYFAIKSNFKPPASDKWKFWRVFNDPKSLTLSWLNKTSELVFVERKRGREGESEDTQDNLTVSPNDLVVDCSSMCDLADSGGQSAFKDVLDFNASRKVIHTNYFEQEACSKFIRRVLDF